MRTRPDRRFFLLGSLASATALARPITALARPITARPAPGPRPTLILVQLTGGHDGLSMLVPYADDAYARARENLRIGAKDVLRIDGRVGLHPELKRLRELFGSGRLALFEGVGYPDPNRSHFRSMDIWHAADARGRGLAAGWIGRSVECLADATPLAVVHLGARPPFSLYSAKHAPLSLTPGLLRATDPARARGLQAARELDGDSMEGGSTPDTSEVGHVRQLWLEAQDSLATLHAALERPATVARYPANDFAADLRAAASLVHAELGVRVVSVELDGFDTHRDQRGRHARLMATLDAGLGALHADLVQSEAGRAALVLVFSEFGRRVAENASGGTDHGAASLAFALGPKLRGGFHGKPPALDRLDDGDLAFTTDFRRIYATCIQNVFALPPADVLGEGFEPIRFV
ncbi:MAG: DUF1501 domain-containing protein [Planctomycetes bacterium]|nr:DUF1501 domain-containing protein [Planctomycetota bacterium]